jgi:hypothetical protein
MHRRTSAGHFEGEQYEIESNEVLLLKFKLNDRVRKSWRGPFEGSMSTSTWCSMTLSKGSIPALE